MPSLLSPQSKLKSPRALEDEQDGKMLPRKKSMMGRLKSKLSTKLGIKKQPASSSHLEGHELSPTTKDLRAGIEPHGELTLAPPREENQRHASRNEDEDEEDERSLKAVAVQVPKDKTQLNDEERMGEGQPKSWRDVPECKDSEGRRSDVETVSQDDVDNDDVREVDMEQRTECETVSSTDMTVDEPHVKAMEAVDQLELSEEEDELEEEEEEEEEDEEKVEVFAEQSNDMEGEEQAEVEAGPEEHQLPADNECEAGPHPDLIVIGRSASSLSSAAQQEEEALEHAQAKHEVCEAIVKGAKGGELDLAKAVDAKSEPLSIATAPDTAAAGAPHSPLRRRNALSPSSRTSFSREEEQQLAHAYNATYPVSATESGYSRSLGRSEHRNSLQRIQEEVTSQIILEHLPPRPSTPKSQGELDNLRSARRRSSSLLEAPILSSSFGVRSSPEEDQEDDIPEALGSAEDQLSQRAESTNEQLEEDESCPFAFDAAAAITQEFGERVARLLGADPWGDRQDGFDSILYMIKKTDLENAKNKKELFCASIAAIQCGVEDRVAPVMYCALDCFRGILKEFSPFLDRSFLRYQPMNEQLSNLARSLIIKLGDSNKRTHREASQSLLRLARVRKLKTIAHILLHLSAKEVSARQRVDALHLLVKDMGIQAKHGLSVDVVMQFTVPALKIAEEKTRKAAVELVAELHLMNSSAVKSHLVGLKPEMLRVINRRVEEMAAKREQEELEKAQEMQKNTNQAEDKGTDEEASMLELVSVPSDEAPETLALLESQLTHIASELGPVVWRKLESKTWSDRKEALLEVEKHILEAKSDLRDVKAAFGTSVQRNFAGYCALVHKCLGDSIAPVVNSAMDCFITLIKVYGSHIEWREEFVRDTTLLTITRLFTTMQKPNNRMNRAACRCILKLTRITSIHPLRYALSCIFTKETDPMVQMHLLRLLVPEFGFQPDGICASMTLDATALALGHASDKVRKVAIDVALCTQRLVGRDIVLTKLKDVKPATLKELEKNFVDCESHRAGERPPTVHQSTTTSAHHTDGSRLPPVSLPGGESSRRLLNSAPVGIGKLHCTPGAEDDRMDSDAPATATARRASILSNDEENLMDAILGADEL